MRAHLVVGQRGEDLAAAWYRERGYQVVARNWRTTFGEIDLVLRRGGVVVICEVKARSSGAFGSPALAVTPAKQARLRRLAAAWLAGQRRRRGSVVRFDVVAVTMDPAGAEIVVYEDAF